MHSIYNNFREMSFDLSNVEPPPPPRISSDPNESSPNFDALRNDDRSHRKHRHDDYDRRSSEYRSGRRYDDRRSDKYRRRHRSRSRSKSPSSRRSHHHHHHRRSRSRSHSRETRRHRRHSRDRRSRSDSIDRKTHSHKSKSHHDKYQSRGEDRGRSKSPIVRKNTTSSNEHVPSTIPSKKHNAAETCGYDENNADFDKEAIQKKMQEHLRQHLAREGKVYPTPKVQPIASHPIFANDGSFLETFKRLQQQQQQQPQLQQQLLRVETPKIVVEKPAVPLPTFGKRRGGKILKTGMVQKQRILEDGSADDGQQTDAWSLYMKEVKQYKKVSCDADGITRSLVK